MPDPDLNQALARNAPELEPTLQRIAGLAPAPAWAVGGLVRDLLAGRSPADIDLAIDGPPRAFAEAIAAYVGGSPFPLDEERGAYRIALPSPLPLMREGPGVGVIDVSPLRGPTIEADLAARDFTIDAMGAALSPAGLGPLIDPTGGRDDLRRSRVRMTSASALDEDPLRLLRAVRLATELGFAIESTTAAAIRERAPRLLEAAGERQREEVVRLFASSDAARGLRLLDATGLLDVLFPESAAGRGVEQPGDYHYYDVLDHGIEAVAVLDGLLSGANEQRPSPREGRHKTRMAPKLPAMRDGFSRTLARFPLAAYFTEAVGGHSRLVLTKLATFLHDVSKPETRTTDASGRVRFLGHPEKGAAVARAVCRRLRFGNRETAFVLRLVEEHLRPAQLSQSGAPTERAIFRFFRDAGEAAPAVLVLSLADAASAVGPRLTAARWQAQCNYVAYVLERGLGQALTEPFGGGKRHFVSGDTLIRELDLVPGPNVGRLLAAIDEAAAGGELTTREEAIDLARTLNQGGPPA
ncbi:MAG TPA: HD domain-containing protein [Dehalococcoidia bacterium]